MLIRGMGPALGPLGVARALARPTITLHDMMARQIIGSNLGWESGPDKSLVLASTAQLGALALVSGSPDAAMLRTLLAGVYTANVSSADDATGVALVEIYDGGNEPQSRLSSVAARSQVGTGENVLILGVVIAGPVPKQVLVRGVGPTLTTLGVTNVLTNPKISLYNAAGSLIDANDDWGGAVRISEAAAKVGAFALPENSRDACLLVTLLPGVYTAHVSGIDGTTGVALVELYDVTTPPPETRWTMINVSPYQGQADCHLIEFPDGRTVLIDAAEGGDAAGSALGYLRSRNISAIDLVVLSHFHVDHYGALADMIEAGIKIGRVAINLPLPGNESIEGEFPWGFSRGHVMELLNYLRQKGVPFFTPTIGERLLENPLGDGTSASLDVVCLYDGTNTPVGKTDTNDTSIIVRLSHGRTRALFTGDLNHSLGAWLAGSHFDLSADLMKAPHHGTAGCAPPEFFNRVGAKAILVPSPPYLWRSIRSKMTREYYSERNIPAFVSGIDGHVTVKLNQGGFTVHKIP